ncbi:serine/threonine-protein kinase [Nannocystis pusilla]|uniref:serine/threonine-protein kinase n=1 Tax=Nannocystis pusilla TaxID=889268 RepID=UPI003B7EDDB4
MAGHEAGTIVAGRYRLGRVLAQGGMGSIWVARHLQLDVDVALKFMAPELADSAELRARFEREAKAAAMLKSPHAVQVHDYGIEDGAPYIVMELLEGEDLATRLARERRLSLAATRRIVEDVGKALRRAHEIGLIHRDMKPANIFLARQAGDEVVKILDFGIAKSTGVIDADQPTHADAVLGSPRYMSPEQVRSSTQVDHRTDLWSLGVIAFRCLTGKLPFRDGEIGDVFVSICTAPIPAPRRSRPTSAPRSIASSRAPWPGRSRSGSRARRSWSRRSRACRARANRRPCWPRASARRAAGRAPTAVTARPNSADAAGDRDPGGGTRGRSGSRLRVALFVVGGLSVIGLVAALVWGSRLRSRSPGGGDNRSTDERRACASGAIACTSLCRIAASSAPVRSAATCAGACGEAGAVDPSIAAYGRRLASETKR